eukprot:gene39919-12889_t
MSSGGGARVDDLGEPVQKLLRELKGRGREVDQETIDLLSHITVRQLATIYDKIGEQQQEPEVMLGFLRKRAMSAMETAVEPEPPTGGEGAAAPKRE